MEQTSTTKQTKKVAKKNDSSAIRFDKTFMRQISRLVEKANKKPFGRKIKPKDIVKTLFSLVDDSLLEKVIKKVQEESLTIDNKKEIFFKKHINQFEGSKEKFEEKMMELMKGFLSQEVQPDVTKA